MCEKGKKWFLIEKILVKRNQNQIKNRYNKILNKLKSIDYLEIDLNL